MWVRSGNVDGRIVDSLPGGREPYFVFSRSSPVFCPLMTVPKRHATTIPLAVPAPGVVKSSGWRQLGTRGVRAGYLVIARCSYLASSFLLFVVLVRVLLRGHIDLCAIAHKSASTGCR